MKKPFCSFTVGVFLSLTFLVSGCSYTRKASLPENYKTIFVDTVKNKTELANLTIYVQGLEMMITNDIIKRLNEDGNLRVVQDRDSADLVLDSTLTRLEQEGTRFSNLESVDEYRLFPVMSVELRNGKTNEVIWQEPQFSGDAEYFVSQIKNLSRQEAAERAAKSLAKNLVARIVEDW
ncbi:MAG: hypothetical protein EXS63_06775 [Candidatus Omnitrophica bacterium]|nr:hypothetical protein [Candidatus Omnitrophota bacterium]